MAAVIFIVGLEQSEQGYKDLMVSDKNGWSIQNKVMNQLPSGTKTFITRWDHNVADEIQAMFPQDELIIVGHSYGGGRAVWTASQLDRPIKKLILLDPVEMNKGTVPNINGFTVSSNVKEVVCLYRDAKQTPFSSYVKSATIPANGVFETRIQNTLYIPKNPNNIDAAHGEKVWSKDLINLIKAAL